MIAIIDYGMGNLRSVQKAFEFLGYEAVITDSAEKILSADHVVLPGVGAFRDAMDKLNTTGLTEVVKKVAASGTPLLGICLGMQLMFEHSEENGYYDGLGLFPGTVTHFPASPLKVPHMGWNTLQTRDCPLFDAGTDACVYFVHSYCMADISDEFTAAVADYIIPFTAAIARGNVMATQFHPEKSGECGLKMLRRFAEWKGEKAEC